MSLNREAMLVFRNAIKPYVQSLCVAHGKTGEVHTHFGCNFVVCAMMSYLDPTPRRPEGPKGIPMPLRRILRGAGRIRPISFGNGWVGIASTELAPSELFLFCNSERFDWKATSGKSSTTMRAVSQRTSPDELTPQGDRELSHRIARDMKELIRANYCFQPFGPGPLFSRYRTGSPIWITGRAMAGLKAFLGDEKIGWRVVDLGRGSHRLELWGESVGVVLNFVPGLPTPDFEDLQSPFIIDGTDSDKPIDFETLSKTPQSQRSGLTTSDDNAEIQ